MSNEDGEMPTLNKLFKSTVRDVEKLNQGSGIGANGAPQRQDSLGYQQRVLKLLTQLLQIRNEVYNLSLFSDNETLDDLGTKDIKFLAAEYYLAEAVSKKLDFTMGSAAEGDLDVARPIDYGAKSRNLGRARALFIAFLTKLKNYGLLNEFQMKKMKNTDDPETFGSDWKFQDARTRREEKIATFKLEKQINANIAEFEKRYPKFFELENEDENSIDEETLRELYTSKLKLLSLQAFSQLELLGMEIEVLKHRPTTQIHEIPTEKPNKKTDDNKLTEENDYGYTEKLESINRGKEQLISKEGRVLQPFRLVATKEDIKKKVFGYGQTLPTMSVEEYIDEEIRRGGIKTETYKGDEKEAEENSEDDDTDDDDEKLYEKRKWDEFKDTHARGEGNRKNKG